MKLALIPAYDEPTRANLSIGQRIPWDANTQTLFDAHATRANLHKQLTASPRVTALFCMSHGTPTALRAQSGDALTQQPNDARALTGVHVFAYACHTATSLGRYVVREAKCAPAWLGYTGAITAPPDDPTLSPLFASLFHWIAEHFHQISARDLIDALKQRCDHAAEQVDQLCDQDPSLDVMGAYYALNHLWQRLRAWITDPDAHTPPLQHAEAPPPSLFGP